MTTTRNPNIQQFPRSTPMDKDARHELDLEIQRGRELMNFNFTSLEKRVVGQYTDLHKAKAAEIFNVPYDQVTDTQREYAKTVGYVDLYTCSTSFAEALRRMKEEAEPK